MGLTAKDINHLGPAALKQVMDKLGTGEVNTKAKYGNQKVTRVMPNGETMTFASQKEAHRYDELMLLLRAGEIRDLCLQAQYTLQEGYITSNGDRIRPIRYVADFVYEHRGEIFQMRSTGELCNDDYVWTLVVEDVKGVKTKEYSLKKKLMAEKFGIMIQEV